MNKIATEMAKTDSIFSVEDRIGFVHDALALTKSGYMEISSALTLVDSLRDDKECKISRMASMSFSDWFTVPTQISCGQVLRIRLISSDPLGSSTRRLWRN